MSGELYFKLPILRLDSVHETQGIPTLCAVWYKLTDGARLVSNRSTRKSVLCEAAPQRLPHLSDMRKTSQIGE